MVDKTWKHFDFFNGSVISRNLTGLLVKTVILPKVFSSEDSGSFGIDDVRDLELSLLTMRGELTPWARNVYSELSYGGLFSRCLQPAMLKFPPLAFSAFMEY